jgi:chromate reductase|uniref:NADPH-dependent FMN reductase n=1 Tax=Yoonia sp. TaxID=2212373 RepID=UPI004047D79C|tara:strand:- start:8026 stop:8556 length:531 start_codon:yes stop_codon:yes gene_type:complete
MTKLLGISGALRKASTNTALMRQAAEIFAPSRFIQADLDLPLYNGDVEKADGIPAAVQTLADQIKAADAIIIASPEYNKGITGVLKNALDWVSRTEGGPWAKKPVAIMSAAAGRAGGERSQYALRLALAPFDIDLVQGPEVLIGANSSQFDAAGKLTNDRYIATLTTLMEKLRAKL